MHETRAEALTTSGSYVANMPVGFPSAKKKYMTKLPDETITTVFTLQRRLLERINEATATALNIFEQFGETELTVSELEQLDNIRERATSAYSRLYTLLLRIAESQPVATSATLTLLARLIEQAQATESASEATIQEIKSDLML